MNTFTASNGIPVRRASQGHLTFSHEFGLDLGVMTGITVAQEQALREFFLDEAGVWIDEQTGALALLNRQPVDRRYVSIFLNGTMYGVHEPYPGDGFDSTPQQQVAKRFFEAHPERKPWEEAKDGSIWEFENTQYLADKGRFFRLPLVPPSDPEWRPACFASNFTDGRMVWSPGDAS